MGFHFYFLTGCPDEMPSSLAERILYELVEDESLEIQKSIDFPFNEHEGNRVKIENLPLNKKADVEKCKDKFKAYFQKRFHFADTDSFEQFIEQGLPLMPHKYVATVFSILETHWDYNESVLLEYLQWLMTTFNQVHQNVPTFIFLFVVHFPNIHDESKADEQHKAIVKKLEDLCTANTMALLREITPVEEKHVKDWFYELGINNPNKIQPVLSEFIKTLDKNDLLTIKNGHGFHMKDVEPLQEKVVQTFRARFKP